MANPATDQAPQRRRHRGRKSTMTGAEFSRQRDSLDLSVADLAALLDCREQTIRNIEQGGEKAPRPGRQLVRLLKVLCDVRGRAVVEAIVREERLASP